jgi:hypothetical protein
MSVTNYTFSRISDFTNGFLAPQLHDNIIDSNISSTLVGIGMSGDVINVTFQSALSSPDLTTLNNIVSSFSPRNIVFFSGVTVDNITYSDSPYLIGYNSLSCDTTGGNVIVLLRQASKCTGAVYAIEKSSSDGNIVIITPYGNDLISGSNSATLSIYNGYLIIKSNGSTWQSSSINYIDQISNSLLIDMSSNVTNTFYDATISSTQSITSTTYVMMKSITPPSGTYAINFSASLTCSTSATVYTSLVLGIGPSTLPSTSATSTSNIVTVNFAAQAIVQGGTNGSQSQVLYVSSVTSGVLNVGQYLTGTGIVAGTTILSIQLGSGGTGIYIMSIPNSIANGTTITAGAAGYVIGQNILVYGFTPSSFNGLQQILSITATSLKFALSVPDQTATVQGYITPAGYLPVTGASSVSNVVTLTFSGNPITSGFLTGQQIIVTGFTSPVTSFNGTWTITSISSSTITYTSTSGGTTTSPSTSFGAVGLLIPGTSRNSLVTTTASSSTTSNKNVGLDGVTPISVYWYSTAGTITCKGSVFNMTRIV